MDEQPDHPVESPPDEAPEFGPRGYLPERASRRARKIVLRAPMGIQWVIGSLVVGVVVLVAGVVLLRDPAPSDPFVALDVPPTSQASTTVAGDPLPEPVLFVGVSRPRVFALPEGVTPAYCEASGLLEAPEGAWRLTGRGLGGTASLSQHPTVVHDGTLYVDPTTLLESPPASDEPAETACAAAG